MGALLAGPWVLPCVPDVIPAFLLPGSLGCSCAFPAQAGLAISPGALVSGRGNLLREGELAAKIWVLGMLVAPGFPLDRARRDVGGVCV